MTDEKKDTVSYSVIAGELRKAVRQYEVFKHASEAADVLASYSRDEARLIKEIGLLKNEVSELDALCDEAYNNKSKADKATSDANVEAGKIVQRAKKEASDIKHKASAYASKTKEEMETVLSETIDKIGVAKNEMNDAVNAKNDAVSALAKVDKQIQTAKDKFLKTLG